MKGKTVILGASTNPTRYAYLAAEMLLEYNHSIVPVGIRTGTLLGHEILDLHSQPPIDDVDTITLYIGEKNQSEWIEYILELAPKRIIFNPGAENDTLSQKAKEKGIETVQGCTLVMLRTGQF